MHAHRDGSMFVDGSSLQSHSTLPRFSRHQVKDKSLGTAAGFLLRTLLPQPLELMVSSMCPPAADSAATVCWRAHARNNGHISTPLTFLCGQLSVFLPVFVLQVVQFLDSPEYSHFDRIIFDTAPTGHTLRLLTLPDFLDKVGAALCWSVSPLPCLSLPLRFSEGLPLWLTAGSVIHPHSIGRTSSGGRQQWWVCAAAADAKRTAVRSDQASSCMRC